MKMNPIKTTVKNAIEKPNLIIAAILVLLPSILALVIYVIYSLPIDFLFFAIMIVRDVLHWILAVIALYILLYIAKGSVMKGKFTGLLTAFSFIYAIRFLLIIATFITVLFMAPGFFEQVSDIASKNYTGAEAIVALQTIPIQAPPFIFFAVLALVIFAVAMVILGLYILYETIALSAPSGRLMNIALLILQLFLFALIQFVVL